MKRKYLYLTILSTICGIGIGEVVPSDGIGRPHVSPPPPSNWSPDENNPIGNTIGSKDPHDNPPDTDSIRYRNPRILNDNRPASSPDPADLDSAHYRIRRASNDPFSTTVEKMLKMSRVINGIALQQDITNGTVKSDVVIMELLDLLSLDFGNLNELSKVVDSIQGLSGKLNKNKTEAGRIERRFRMYDFMLELTRGLGKEVNITGKDIYLGEITALKEKGVQLGDLTAMCTRFSNMAKWLSDLFDSENPIDKSDAKIIFESFVPTLESLKKNGIKAFGESIESPKLRENMFGPLDGVKKAIEAFSADMDISVYADQKDSEPTGILKGYLEQMNMIRQSSMKVLGSLKLLESTTVMSLILS